mmetsp:Transcript_84315/g.235257  ORF Transcript_84315/g.235257 Transcript_84315/m.235257 type:complete len:331 (-) Transcript_84315:230-1222(-)
MMSSAAKYAQGDEGGDADRSSRMCAETGRRCVKHIHAYPVLSLEWITLVDSLKQLARLVHLDGVLPTNSRLSEARGRDQDSKGTLWDQEANETAIRILVEEAKVNACLRIMIDYKKWQYDELTRTETIREQLQSTHMSEAKLEVVTIQFEEALGMLLFRAFQHVETLQLMDITMLIEYISMVLDYSLVNLAGGDSTELDPKRQEAMVMLYFSSTMRHAEQINNAELLARCRDLQVPNKAVMHVLKFVDQYPDGMAVAVAEGFAALADNEDFSTNWPDFFLGEDMRPDLALKQRFLELEARLAEPLLAANPLKRKDIRPLLDFFKTLRRGG